MVVASEALPQHVWTSMRSSIYAIGLPPAAPYRFVRTRSEADVQPWARAAVSLACQLEEIDDPGRVYRHSERRARPLGIR